MTRAMTPETFWSRTKLVGSCLEWQGSRTHEGYGKTSLNGRCWIAHRLGWFFTHGPIPNGLAVCHACDNPPCVNPAHLFLGTAKDNTADRLAKRRFFQRQGVANPAAKLTEAQVRAIRAEAAQGSSHRKLGRRYGVSHQQVTKIVNRRKWPKVA